MNHAPTSIISELLHLPERVIGYEAGRRLRAMLPERAVFESTDSPFDLDEFERDGQCEVEQRLDIHAQIDNAYIGPTDHDYVRLNGWFDVRWAGEPLQVVRLSWPSDYGRTDWVAIIADTPIIAKRFFDTVCAYCLEVRGEVLVFSDGCWSKDAQLYEAIQSTRLDSLVVKPGLAEEIAGDLQRFLNAKDFYKQYGVPWKRGIILAGPPGNGKTHCVKGLVNRFGLPCLYVRSFHDRYGSREGNVRAVFHRARKAAPCFLVLEDLEALVTDRIRAYFLNELDGFAANEGLVTIATTNYPDRLDPALAERPSRFDVKYTLDLPRPEERRRYLERWCEQVEPSMRPTPEALDRVVDLTDQYSFAFLKELTVSSTVEWVGAAGRLSIDEVLARRAERLRPQLEASANLETTSKPGDN